MISSIDSKWDITVYLEDGDMIDLEDNHLESILVWVGGSADQKKFLFSVDDNVKHVDAQGGVLETSKGAYSFYISSNTFGFLKKYLGVNQRYLGGRNGSKVEIFDMSKTEDIILNVQYDFLKKFVDSKRDI